MVKIPYDDDTENEEEEEEDVEETEREKKYTAKAIDKIERVLVVR